MPVRVASIYRELWADAACFFPSDNRRALAGALDTLAANPAMTAAYGDLAQARAERFDASRMVDEYLALYEELRRQPIAA